MDGYILCTSPRSGSTLLCELLASTGVAGDPETYFHWRDVGACREKLGLPASPAPGVDAIGEMLTTMREKAVARDGLFALRLQEHGLRFFQETLAHHRPNATNDAERIAQTFGALNFIYLRRADKVAQAVSWEIARQSGLFHRNADGSELERLSPHAEPTFDEGSLIAVYDHFVAADAAWEAWFASSNLNPLQLTYDALSNDPQSNLALVLDFLGIQASSDVPTPTKKLADAQNAEWCARLSRALEG